MSQGAGHARGEKSPRAPHGHPSARLGSFAPKSPADSGFLKDSRGENALSAPAAGYRRVHKSNLAAGPRLPPDYTPTPRHAMYLQSLEPAIRGRFAASNGLSEQSGGALLWANILDGTLPGSCQEQSDHGLEHFAFFIHGAGAGSNVACHF